jgi:hypothetical protein
VRVSDIEHQFVCLLAAVVGPTSGRIFGGTSRARSVTHAARSVPKSAVLRAAMVVALNTDAGGPASSHRKGKASAVIGAFYRCNQLVDLESIRPVVNDVFALATDKRNVADELADHGSKAKFLYVADKHRGEDLPLVARAFDSPSLSVRNRDSVVSLETLVDQPSTKGGNNGFAFGWHLRSRRKPVARRIMFDLPQVRRQASLRRSVTILSHRTRYAGFLLGDLRAQYVPNAAKRPYFAWAALFYL